MFYLFYRNAWTNRTGFWRGCFNPSSYPTRYYKEIQVPSIIRVFPFWNFVSDSGHRNFRHGKSVVLSTSSSATAECRLTARHATNRVGVSVSVSLFNCLYTDLVWNFYFFLVTRVAVVSVLRGETLNTALYVITPRHCM